MPDRSTIGLDNPVFYGRLRSSPRRAQSLAVHSSSMRPSVRYYNNDVIVPVVRTKITPKQKAVASKTPAIQIVKPQTFQVPSGHAPQPSRVLKRQIVRSPRGAAQSAAKKRKTRYSNWSRPQIALMAMAVVIFVIGIAVSAVTLRVDHTASSQVAALSKNAATQPATSDTAAGSATATPPPGPSVTKPSKTVIANYVVAPDLPKYLDIPKLSIHTRILSLGILNNGALATPNNIYDTGWYNASAKPADPPTSGAMLIDGHSAGYNAAGIFYNLKKLVGGDTLSVTRGDGKVFTYKVVKSQTYDADNVDMQAAITPVTPGKPGLNLITCAGEVDPHTYHFLQRLIVFAEQV